MVCGEVHECLLVANGCREEFVGKNAKSKVRALCVDHDALLPLHKVVTAHTWWSCHYYSQSVSTSPFLHSRRAHWKAGRKSPRQSEHSVWFSSIRYMDTSALFDYHLRAKGNHNHSLTKKHFKNKCTQFCFVNENCDQSSVRLRQCVPGAACSTASVPSSNCLKFKSRKARVTPFEKFVQRTLDTGLVFDERFLWRTLGCVLAYSADVIGPGRIAQSNTSVFFSQIFGTVVLGLPGLWALGWWSGHVGTWLKRGSNVWLTLYSPYRTEHTYPEIILYPCLVLTSRDIFGWPSSMVNNLKQAELPVAGERVAELEIRKTGERRLRINVRQTVDCDWCCMMFDTMILYVYISANEPSLDFWSDGGPGCSNPQIMAWLSRCPLSSLFRSWWCWPFLAWWHRSWGALFHLPVSVSLRWKEISLRTEKDNECNTNIINRYKWYMNIHKHLDKTTSHGHDGVHRSYSLRWKPVS